MDAPASHPCPRCGRPVEGDESESPCEACRRSIVRRATWWAWVPVVVVVAAYGWLLVWSGLIESPMMVFWLALGAVLAFVAFKVGRRVFFDLLRGDGRRARR